MVAARRGIAVLQNHQSDGSSSVSGRMWMRHVGFLWEETEKRRRWGGVAGEYLVGSALLLLLGGEMESVVVMVVWACALLHMTIWWLLAVHHGSGTSRQTSISGEPRWFRRVADGTRKPAGRECRSID